MPECGASVPETKPLHFVQRYLNQGIFPVEENEDSSVSTHRMAAEVDFDGNYGPKGNWYAFPTIIQEEGGDLTTYDDPREAMSVAMKSGQYIDFGLDKADALSYAEGGYKTPEGRGNKKAYDKARKADDWQRAYTIKKRARAAGADTSSW